MCHHPDVLLRSSACDFDYGRKTLCWVGSSHLKLKFHFLEVGKKNDQLDLGKVHITREKHDVPTKTAANVKSF